MTQKEFAVLTRAIAKWRYSAERYAAGQGKDPSYASSVFAALVCDLGDHLANDRFPRNVWHTACEPRRD
jgi:hypothetical protein